MPYLIEVLIFIDTRHILDDDYSRIITIVQGKEAVDIALIN